MNYAAALPLSQQHAPEARDKVQDGTQTGVHNM